MPDEPANVAAVLDHKQNDAKQAQQCRQLAAGGEHADGRDERTADAAERHIARGPDDAHKNQQRNKAGRKAHDQQHRLGAEDALAAAKAVKHRVDVAEHDTKARKHLPRGRRALRAHNEPAGHDGDDSLEYIRANDDGEAGRAERAVEIRQAGVAAAVIAHIAVKDVFRCDDRPVEPAEQVGENGDGREQSGDHSCSPFCRMTMRMGVPSRPNTARIWFSR